MKTSKKYTKELKRQFGYFATWLPSTPLSLGDIGVFKQDAFTKISSLANFNISFEVEPDNTTSDIEHSSAGSVSMTIKASGTTSPPGSTLADMDAGIIVEFRRENAILFKALGTTSPSIKNQIELGKQIIKMYERGQWDKDWAVVTEVVNAKSTTVLISSSASGRIELKAEAKIDAQVLDIAEASLHLAPKFSKDLSTCIIAQDALTPLFKVSMIKASILAPPEFSGRKNISITPIDFNASNINAMDLLTPALAKENQNILDFHQIEVV